MARKKVSVRRNEELRSTLQRVFRDDILNTVCDQIKIENLPPEIPSRWLKYLVFEVGEFAVWKDMYLRIVGRDGVRIYGEPTRFMLMAPNNATSVYVDRSELAWIGCNQTRTPLIEYIDYQARKLCEIEVSLIQNLIASRCGDIISVADDDVVLSLENAIMEKQLGVPVVIANKKLQDNISQYQISVEFIADKLHELESRIIQETLVHIGIISNESKRERVQVGEVEASAVYAYDCIYTIIDSINEDCEKQGVALRIKFNGSLDDFTGDKEEVQEDE